MKKPNKYEKLVKPRLSEIKEWYQTKTEKEIADLLGVSLTMLKDYKRRYTELADCFDAAQQRLIDDLRDSLKLKAKGFTYKETKKTTRIVGEVKTYVIEEYERYSPPDVGAIHLLLKNIDPTWRNDDQVTIDMKREKLEIERQKGEVW